VKRGFVVAVGSMAIVIAGLSGCSSEEKSESGSATSAEATSAEATTEAGTGTASAGSGGTKITIDGQDQNVSGSVVCTAMGGNMNIAIGEAATAIAAVVSEGDAPTVQSVGLGNVNGVVLGYTSGTGQGDATAEKDGKSYKISGTATGVDMANPMQPVNKPFEISVVCP
jgi:ipoprotein LpqH